MLHEGRLMLIFLERQARWKLLVLLTKLLELVLLLLSILEERVTTHSHSNSDTRFV
jgi:hypothetical protein